MPAGNIGKEVTIGFLQAAFAEVMQLVGLALPGKDKREPAAALAAAAAGAGDRWGVLRFHTIRFDRNRCKDNGAPEG
jgi:hypothetical protein